jgi:hypothetical protein
MSSESQRVKDSKESLKDSELSTCKRNPTEVTEKLGASEGGTQPESDSPLPELVNWDTTTEPKSTRKYIKSETDKTKRLPPLRSI